MQDGMLFFLHVRVLRMLLYEGLQWIFFAWEKESIVVTENGSVFYRIKWKSE